MSNVVPNDPYLRLMFCLPEACRVGIMNCSIKPDTNEVNVLLCRGKTMSELELFNLDDSIEGFPSNSLLGKIILYLQ